MSELKKINGPVNIVGELEATSLDINGAADISGAVVMGSTLDVAGHIQLTDGAQRNIIGALNQNLGIYANPNGADEGIKFSTDEGSTIEMIILNGGNVGIGTASPSDKVEVYSNGADVALRIHEDAGTHQARLHLRRGGSDWEIINDNHLIIEGEGVERFRINTSGNATFAGTIGSGAITSTGKITGTELEGTSLDINGNAAIDGDLVVTDSNAFVTIQGSDTSYVNAAVQFTSNQASTSRGMGNFYYSAHSDVEWFSGCPYGGNDAFVINRNASYTVPSSGSSPPGIGASTGTKFSINSSGNATFAGDLTINDTSGTRGISRNNTGYNLQLMGGTDNSDGAFISLSGETRGGTSNAYNGRIEIYSGGGGLANQAAALGDIIFGTKWNGGSSNILVLDSSTNNATFAGNVVSAGFVGRLQGGLTGAPDATIWCVSNDYTNWGIFYDESTPDLIQFKSSGNTKATIALDNGNIFSAGTITADGQITGGEIEGTSLDINGNADISGTLTVHNTLTVNKTQGSSALTINHAGNGGWTQYASTNDGAYGYIGAGAHLLGTVVNDNDFVIRAQEEFAVSIAATEKMRINSSGNATFAGNITTTGNINAGSAKYLRFTSAASNSDAAVLFGNTSGTGGSLTFKRNSDSAAILTLNGDKNATFAGNVDGVATLTATTLSVTNYGLASGDIPNNAADTTGTASNAALLDNIDSNQFAYYNSLTFADSQEKTNRSSVFPAPGRSTTVYPASYQRTLNLEFKSKGTMNNPGTGNSWLGIISMAPYATGSSFYTNQIAMGADGANSDLFIRRGNGTGNGTWGDWRQIITADSATFTSNLTVGGNSLTAGSLDINGNADISGNLTGLDDVTSDNYYINDTNTRLSEGSGNSLKITTNSGNLQIGPQNSSWCHVYTDRASFYLNTTLTVDGGIIQSYNENLVLRRAGSTSHQLTISENVAEFTGEVECASLDVNGGANISGSLLVATATDYYSGCQIGVGDTSDSQNGLSITTSTTGNAYVLFGDGTGTSSYIGQIRYAHNGDFMDLQTGGGVRLKLNAAGATVTGKLEVSGEIEGTSLDINGNAAIDGLTTLTHSVHPLVINRTGGATALINLQINGTSEGYIGATSTKSFVVYNEAPAERFSVSNAGVVTATNDVIAFSDRKLKENIETLDGKKVLDMRGVSFTRKDTGAESSGVIAQEIQKVAPELVHDTEGTLGVAYGNLVGYLIEAIKDQQKQIDELKEICNGCSK